MKKLFLFILILGVVFSCEKDLKVNNEIVIYPNKYIKDSIVTYRLENFTEIKSLMDSLDNLFSVKLTFKDSLILKSVYPKALYKYSCITIPLYKDNIVLAIDKFSAIKNDTVYSINNLKNIFKKDFLNIDNNPYYCKNPNKLVILINTKNSDIVTLKKQLITITRAYDSLNVDYSLNIELREFIKPPPPPPKNRQKKNLN